MTQDESRKVPGKFLSDPDPELTALVLMTSYQENRDYVAVKARKLFEKHLLNKTHVHSIFFSDENRDPNESKISNNFKFEDFSTAYVCAAIGICSASGFNKTVYGNKCRDIMKDLMGSTEWRHLGFELYSLLFPEEVSYGGISFQHFLDRNPKEWGRKLFEAITDPDFVNNVASAIIHNEWPDYNRQLNIIFFKLHLLDSTLVEQAVSCWTDALAGKVTEEWRDYDYLDSYRDMNIDSIQRYVNQAINVKTVNWIPSHSDHGSHYPPACEETYGKEVEEFVNSYASKIGVRTGTKPDNYHVSFPSPSCFVAGTKVTLSNGTTCDIKDIKADTKVMSFGGSFASRSHEEVINFVDKNQMCYGINEEPPFFTVGHAFWTTEGWKAVEPDVAREENPHIQFSHLQVGDIVFQIADTNPLLYKPVKIEKITSKAFDSPSLVYGLHLIDGRSYHANGFAVIMNYPLITEKRILEGFKKLTASEQDRLRSSLTEVLPELSKTLGNFMPATLYKNGILEPIFHDK